MRGIDTNIVIRLLLRDDPEQVAAIDTLMAAGGLMVPYTVLIETEWVLRAVYRLERSAIAAYLRSLAMLDGISVPDPAGLIWATQRYSGGADFADMIHLVSCEASSFLTFDRDFVRRAGKQAPCPVALVR